MGIDFETLIILAILAFVLFGPEKLPEYAAKAGHLIARLREASAELSQQAQASLSNPQQPPAKAPAQPAVGEPAPYQPPPAQPVVNRRTCPTCTQIMGYGFTYCPYCGCRLKDEAAAPAPPQPPLAS